MTKSFNKSKFIKDRELILRYDAALEEYAWECGEEGATGFASMNEAETDALFWMDSTDSYIYHLSL